MAIAGLLVHSLTEDLENVEKVISSMEEMTTYGIHENQYVVVVVEAPSDVMEKVVKQLEKIKGVLSIYTTYLTVEDEMDEDGNLQTDLSLIKTMRKKGGKKMNID